MVTVVRSSRVASTVEGLGDAARQGRRFDHHRVVTVEQVGEAVSAVARSGPGWRSRLPPASSRVTVDAVEPDFSRILDAVAVDVEPHAITDRAVCRCSRSRRRLLVSPAPRITVGGVGGSRAIEVEGWVAARRQGDSVRLWPCRCRRRGW